MTAKEVYEGLKKLGYPVAYSHFSEGDVPKTPFVTYSFPGTNNFAADGTVYVSITELDIDLYTDKKNLEDERKIEKWLTENGMFYNKQEVYLESEKWLKITYETNL